MANAGDTILAKLNQECNGAITSFKRELGKVRSGRASTGLVDTLMVDYYGSKTQLSHLAQLSTPEPRLILVQVYDTNAIAAIEKAVKTSGLGFNPQREGNTLRIVVPALTEETRKDIIKHLHKMAEEVRVSIRNHRRDANDAGKKAGKDAAMTEDEVKKLLDKVQKQTDAFIHDVDKLLSSKEAEVKEV